MTPPPSRHRAIALRHLAPILALAVAYPVIAQDQTPPESAIFSLRALTTQHAPTPRLPFRTFLGLRELESWPSLVPSRNEYEPLIEADELLNYLSNIDSRLGEDDLQAEPHEHHLWIRGGKAGLRRTQEHISELRSHLLCPIAIEATVIRHDGKLLPPTVVDAGQARALFEGHKPSWSGTAHTTSNMSVYLGHHRAVSYLHTHDAEIASAQRVFVPRQEETFDGVGIVAVPHRTAAGEDLVLQVQLAVGDLVAMQNYDTGLSGEDALQRPTVKTTAASMSGRIKNGGALVFNATAPDELGGNVTVVVRASWTPPKATLPNEVRIIPVSSMTQSGCSLPRFGRTDRVVGAARQEDWQEDEEEISPPIEVDFLMETIRCVVEPDAWDDTASMWQMRGYVALSADEDVLKQSVARILAIEKQMTQTVEVDYALGAGRITFPALIQRNHAARHGSETTGVEGANAEIAEKAKILVPKVTRLFQGVELAMQPLAAGQELAARLSSCVRQLGAPPTGHGLPPIEIAARNFTGVIPAGGCTLGESPLGEQRWRLRRQ